MQRRLTLRQIEGFKAVMECGTISNAALLLRVSQPAMSKLIVQLEIDTGLKLFDRLKGRLMPTDRGRRFHEEIDRIFAGVRQLEDAVDVIRREEQRQLTVGVMPALSGAFIQQTTMRFLKDWPKVFCSIQSYSSDRITDWLVTRKLDVGLVDNFVENPCVIAEPLMQRPLVCIMPRGHPLTANNVIRPKDLHQMPFVAFNSTRIKGRPVATILEAQKVKPNMVLVANIVPTICEFVAAGLGVSLTHPLFVSGFEHRLVVRRFEPKILAQFHICRSRESRNEKLIDAFVQDARDIAEYLYQSILSEPGILLAAQAFGSGEA
jgi:DNA-binding transcriptional LysR family regulator